MGVSGLALANLLLYTDILDVMVMNPLRKKLCFLPRFLRRISWTSNIPSSPYAMDFLSTMIAGPFPTLVDHNACMPGLEIPCILKGRPPKGVTYWSVQVYMKEAANVMNERKGGDGEEREGDKERRNQTLRDIDISLSDDGTYEIFIGDWFGPTPPARNAIRANGSAKGLLVIRAFNVPSGSTWRAPLIFDAGEGCGGEPMATKFDERVSGPFASKQGTSVWKRAKGLVMVQGAVAMWSPETFRKLALGYVGGVCLHSMLTSLLTRKYKRIRRQATPNTSFTRIPGLGGNADHVYYTLTYDVSSSDVLISGVLNCSVGGREGFRYFNLTCYTWDSLPMDNYADSNNIASENEGKEEAIILKGVRVNKRYKVYLTTERTYQDGVNELSVESEPRGTCTVRILLPLNTAVEDASMPTVEVVPRGFRG